MAHKHADAGEYSWRDGWYFRRLSDGAVRIRYAASDILEHGIDALEVDIPAAEWAAIVHYVSGRTDSESMTYLTQFHQPEIAIGIAHPPPPLKPQPPKAPAKRPRPRPKHR